MENDNGSLHAATKLLEAYVGINQGIYDIAKDVAERAKAGENFHPDVYVTLDRVLDVLIKHRPVAQEAVSAMNPPQDGTSHE